MKKEARCKWQQCVEGWQSLARQINEGMYKPPIVCLVFNGINIPLILHDVQVQDGRSPCKTTVALTVEGGASLVLSEAKPSRFKYGKDKGGKGKNIFLNDLNR